MKKIALHWQILIALVLAIPFGILFPEATPYIGWTGTIFIRLLKMIVIPLILSSIITSIAGLGGDGFGRLGLKTMVYYITTSALAIITSLALSNIIKPGVGVDTSAVSDAPDIGSSGKSITDTLLNIVPSNIFEALSNNDILAIIFFAIIVGIFASKLKPKQSLLITEITEAIFELFMKITMFVIKLAPIGIFGLISTEVTRQIETAGSGEALLNTAASVGKFALVVMIALAIHGMVWIPLITKVIGKASPIKHFKNLGTTLMTAFSTASSAAALPLNMSDTSKKSGVSEKITNFTLPIGATVNMDGTAIYICAVVLFIAQAQGMDMTLSQQLIVLLTALLTSIGTAAIPMGSLVVITIILDIFGLPFELIAIILPVDRILDMFRTATNVWSDSCGAVIIAKSEGEKLNV